MHKDKSQRRIDINIQTTITFRK